MLSVLLFVLAILAFAFVWGNSEYAPEPLQRFSTVIYGFFAQVGRSLRDLGRNLTGRGQRFPTGMQGSAVDRLMRKPDQRQIQQRMATRVIAPPQTDEERRLFFLHEVQLQTGLALYLTEDDVLHITKRDMRVLTEYCNLYANPVGEPKRLFLLHGIRISVEKNAQQAAATRV